MPEPEAYDSCQDCNKTSATNIIEECIWCSDLYCADCYFAHPCMDDEADNNE